MELSTTIEPNRICIHGIFSINTECEYWQQVQFAVGTHIIIFKSILFRKICEMRTKISQCRTNIWICRKILWTNWISIYFMTEQHFFVDIFFLQIFVVVWSEIVGILSFNAFFGNFWSLISLGFNLCANATVLLFKTNAQRLCRLCGVYQSKNAHSTT